MITKNIEIRYCDSFDEMMKKAEELHREYYGKEVGIMKNYKDFGKEYIGSSDISSLILAGYKEDIGLALQELHFGGDGSYNAYIVKGKDVEIGKHYNKVAEYDSWMKIYDDEELVRNFKADKIIVYRAAEMGCIIQLITDMED